MNRILVVCLLVGCTGETAITADEFTCECSCEDELILVSNQQSELEETHILLTQMVSRQKVLEDILRLFIYKNKRK